MTKQITHDLIVKMAETAGGAVLDVLAEHTKTADDFEVLVAAVPYLMMSIADTISATRHPNDANAARMLRDRLIIDLVCLNDTGAYAGAAQ